MGLLKIPAGNYDEKESVILMTLFAHPNTVNKMTNISLLECN